MVGCALAVDPTSANSVCCTTFDDQLKGGGASPKSRAQDTFTNTVIELLCLLQKPTCTFTPPDRRGMYR